MTVEEQALKTLEESTNDVDTKVVDEIVDEFPVLAKSLVNVINKRTGGTHKVPTKQEHKNRLLSDITSNLKKINGELIVVNSRLQAQNDLLRGNLYVTTNAIGDLEYSDTVLGDKLNSVLKSLQAQNDVLREQEEDRKRGEIEAGAEGQRDAASTFGFTDVSKGKPSIIGRIINSMKALLASPLGKKIAAKYLLKPLLKRFAPGLADSLSKKGMVRTLRGFLPRWLGGTKGIKPNESLFPNVAVPGQTHRKPNMIQRGAQWLNNTPMVKGTKNFLGPLVRPAKNAIGNFMKDPIGNTKMAGKKLLDKAMGNKYVMRLARRLPLITGKFGTRMIPVAGAGFSAAEANYRREKGDHFGAWLAGLGAASDTASAITSGASFTGIGAVIPGALQVVSALSDFGLLGYDLFRAFTSDDDSSFEFGGIIDAPPILSSAFEKGGVVDSSDDMNQVGKIVAASGLLLGSIGASGIDLGGNYNSLVNDYPATVDGVVGIEPMVGLNTIYPDTPTKTKDDRETEKDEKEEFKKVDDVTTTTTDGNSTIEEAILSFRKARHEKYGVSKDRVATDNTFNLAVRELRGDEGGSSINPLADDLSYQDVHKGWAHKEGYAFDIPVADDEQAKFVINHFKSRGFWTLYGSDFGEGQDQIDTGGDHDHHVHIQPATREVAPSFKKQIEPPPKKDTVEEVSFESVPAGQTTIVYVTKEVIVPLNNGSSKQNIVVTPPQKQPKLSRLILAS